MVLPRRPRNHRDTRDLIVGLRDGAIDPLSRLAPGFTLPPGFPGRER